MDTRPAPAVLPLQFHGDTWEYFRIWIVNVCLTALTLGFYAPWAKVRQKRYFYGSTQLADASFDYLANPMAIFKGRLIALGIVMVFSAVSQFLPMLTALVWLVFIIALPWLIVRTLRFNYLNTVYRNIRFGFDADYGKAFVNFVALPFIIAPLSLGLAYPWVVRQQNKFVLDNSAYGNSRFSFNASTGEYWAIFLRLAGLMVLALILGGILTATLVFFAVKTFSLTQADFAGMSHAKIAQLMFLAYVPMLLIFMATTVYLNTALTNLVWNNTTLGGISFRSQLSFRRLLFLYVTNILGIALSLGLLIPWAKIRMARYRLESLAVCCEQEQLEQFFAGQTQTAGAFGEELSDLLDVDIGL